MTLKIHSIGQLLAEPSPTIRASNGSIA